MATRWNETCQQCGNACHYTGATWIDGRRLCKNCRLAMIDKLKTFDQLTVLLVESDISLHQLIREWTHVARTVKEHASMKDAWIEIQKN